MQIKFIIYKQRKLFIYIVYNYFLFKFYLIWFFTPNAVGCILL